MENEKPKKKIPLFPKSKTSFAIRKNNGNAMLSDSSDDSDILQDSSASDYEVEEEQRTYTMIATKNNNQINSLNIDVDKKNNKSSLIPSKDDDFKDIEEYVANNIYDKKITNKNNEDKNKKKEIKSPDQKNNKKENNKIINDFFINNEGDIELTGKNINDIKNKQKSNKNNQNTGVVGCLGPLMEEDELNGTIFLNRNKSIFNSKKELWKFQKILLDNQIFDMNSKNKN